MKLWQRVRQTEFKGLDLRALWQGLVSRDPVGTDRIVPPTGYTAQLTWVSAAIMAFLAVFALALSLATGRLADRWSEGLARSITIRVSAPADQIEQQVGAVMNVLDTTPGIASARALPADEIDALLEPWFGPDVPVSALPVPRLVEVTEAGGDLDPEGLRLRLAAEAPGAVLDDHTRWRRPLVAAAGRIQMLGLASLLLIGLAGAAITTLAAQAALAANGQVIRVLRLIGARDLTIATAFVRRITRRAATGAALGTVLAMLAIALLPNMDAAGGFLTGLGFHGWGWLWPLVVPPVSAVLAFFATRAAALRMLGEVR